MCALLQQNTFCVSLSVFPSISFFSAHSHFVNKKLAGDTRNFKIKMKYCKKVDCGGKVGVSLRTKFNNRNSES